MISHHIIFQDTTTVIYAGWDCGLESFFAIGYDLSDPSEENVLFQVGTKKFEFRTVAALQEHGLDRFGYWISEDIVYELEKDKKNFRPPTPLQERQDRYADTGWATK